MRFPSSTSAWRVPKRLTPRTSHRVANQHPRECATHRVRGSSASASASASVRGGNDDDDDDGRGATTTFGWRPSRESSREASREASQMRTAAGRREEVSSVIRRCVGRTRREARMRTRAGFYPFIFFRALRRVGGSSFLRSFVDGRRARRRKVDRLRPAAAARVSSGERFVKVSLVNRPFVIRRFKLKIERTDGRGRAFSRRELEPYRYSSREDDERRTTTNDDERRTIQRWMRK